MKTAFRAAVMLAVIVGLPWAYRRGDVLPESVQRLAQRGVDAARKAVDWDNIDWAQMDVRAFWQNNGDRDAGVEKLTIAPPFESGGAAPAFGAKTQAMIRSGEMPQSDPPSPLAAQLEPQLALLRQFQPAEYGLSRWGASGQLYRFHCQMPLTADGRLTEHFEAIDADALSAVKQVLAEVTTWRTVRRVRATNQTLASR